MEPIVLILVLVVVIVPLALMLYADHKGVFDDVGGGAFSTDGLSPHTVASTGDQSATATEREAEIRQFVEARNARLAAKGEGPLDIDLEVAKLMSLDPTLDPDAPPKADDELRAEVRQLVLARNERRLAKGEQPLDVEAEIDRQLKDAGA